MSSTKKKEPEIVDPRLSNRGLGHVAPKKPRQSTGVVHGNQQGTTGATKHKGSGDAPRFAERKSYPGFAAWKALTGGKSRKGYDEAKAAWIAYKESASGPE